MKTKSPLQLFLNVFLKSVVVMALVLGAGFGSYKATMLLYKSADAPKAGKDAAAVLDLFNDVPVENVAETLIYHVDETGAIRHMVLELFNTVTYNMDYVTIPIKAQFTLPNDLYRKLSGINADVPQIVSLSDMDTYFQKDRLYEYGIFLLNELFGVKINFYAVLDTQAYDEIFMKKEKTLTYESSAEKQPATSSSVSAPVTKTMTAGVQVFRKKFIEKLSLVDSEQKLEDFVKERYSSVESNLSEKNKLKYIPDYFKVNLDHIYFHCIYGTNEGADFIPDTEAASNLLQKLQTNTAAYMEAQKEEAVSNEKASLGFRIRILNGSNITGLAAGYGEKLSADGYTVTSIGNDVNRSAETTRITVKREGTGSDLLSYFNQAVIQSGTLEEGIDIEIILGSNDAMS